MAGQNKEDVEKAISTVEALVVKLTQKGELVQEKFEAPEGAKKLVNQEKYFACAKIESAREVVKRFGNVEPRTFLRFEVKEARRIKLLHQPSKVMDMEYELCVLRAQTWDKSIFSVKLQRELAISKRVKENKASLYYLDGSETLILILQLHPHLVNALSLSKCANKSMYAFVDIVSNDQKFNVTTGGAIHSAAGLGSYIETFLRKSSLEFDVVIFQINGQDSPSDSVHIFKITKAREIYSTLMQLCGVGGDGNAAAKKLFWQPRMGLSYVLTFESKREGMQLQCLQGNVLLIAMSVYTLEDVSQQVILGGSEDQV
ncbi:hypothetical protein K2173_015055 [Erythroxylum novogranatense]|uniref:Uncharacterized protein n=1 Tax=Erythroxylum novogranatense TaxID=1862640 RepID=A0AAV8T2F3_9ROSI|nr:hypothetical protein K2173_015055 [Erythroxylum novogranatense]